MPTLMIRFLPSNNAASGCSSGALPPIHLGLRGCIKINRSRVRSHLRHELRAQMPCDQAEVVRSAIQCYMDGVWLQAAQAEATLDPAAARREARRVVARLLSEVSLAA